MKAGVYIGVGDTELLYEEFKNTGANIRQKPTNFSWAQEMHVEDLDGIVIRFASDSKEGMPFGSWMNMKGKLWLRDSK